MFSSALKSFSSNINSNYTVDPNPTSISGPWKIYDGKKKSTGKVVSVFVFDRKSLEPGNGGLSRSGGSSLKRSRDEVVERLKKEASSLARLRHPSILELAEPVEETRSGGLQFATEPLSTSLAALLQAKDEEEKAGGIGGRTSRYVVEETDGGGRRRREVEIDELEIQKGLLQIAKGLEFLHESAGLVHGNLTPEAIYINAKSDWKISGLGFSSPPQNSTSTSTVTPISLTEVLTYYPRLPRTVQLNLDFSSPDFVLDSNVNTSADLFSLGLLVVSLYNSPHVSPLTTHGSVSTYQRLFDASSTTPSESNTWLCSRPLPRDLQSTVLPRLLTRRPAQRLNAREFQQSQYFDNILVSTIRFLDSLPAKTPQERAQFMRGLPRILAQFPKAVLEKKVLPALTEEMKDRDHLALILQNVFKIIEMLPSRRRAFTERVIPKLRETFLGTSSHIGPKNTAQERDLGKEAGLMVVLERMDLIVDNCSSKDFKDEILPILSLALESPTHTLVDASLRTLPVMLPVMDFSMLKNDLFPVIASVFSKTSSLGIKVRGLEAFAILCGSSKEASTSPDDLDGIMVDDRKQDKRQNTNPVLDKYTIQEKLIPLMKAIKTKEPAVMVAALDVFKQVGKVADSDFVAMEILPILWSMSLGPLLNLQQFRDFMNLIKSLSSRVDREQTKKLQELGSGSSAEPSSRKDDFMSFGTINDSRNINETGGDDEDDFEKLVLGKPNGTSQSTWNSGSASSQHHAQALASSPPVFSWSTTSNLGVPHQSTSGRTITPDLASFAPFAPAPNPRATPLTPPLQPGNLNTMNSMASFQASSNQPSMRNVWTNQQSSSNHSLPSLNDLNRSTSGLSVGQTPRPTNNAIAFGIPPPPLSSNNSFSTQPPQYSSNIGTSAWSLPPPPGPGQAQTQVFSPGVSSSNTGKPGTEPKSGLDAYQSLL